MINIKYWLSLSVSIILFMLLINPSRSFSETENEELFTYGIILSYAGLCAEKLKVDNDKDVQEEASQIADILEKKYGEENIEILQRGATLGAQKFIQDRGAQCFQILTTAKKMVTSLGVKSVYHDRALSVLELQSQKNRYSQIPSTPAIKSSKIINLTDNLHNQFISEDNDYALADAMLNATWKMVKKNLDKSAFASVQKDQREWASSKRDERAASYAASLPPSQAYTKVMQERIAELASLVAREPRLGDYEAEHQMFNIYKDKGEYQIDGSASSPEGNTCMFEGKLTKDNGWYKVHEDGLPPYFLLFTDKGAFIQYIGGGSEHGCGVNVGFNGEYKFVK